MKRPQRRSTGGADVCRGEIDCASENVYLRRAYANRHLLIELRPESFQIFETKLQEISDDAGYFYNHQMAVVGVFTKKNTGEPMGYFLDLIYDDFHGKRYAEHRASMSRAQRLKRVFNIDIETCPACGGAVRIIASRTSW